MFLELTTIVAVLGLLLSLFAFLREPLLKRPSVTLTLYPSLTSPGTMTLKVACTRGRTGISDISIENIQRSNVLDFWVHRPFSLEEEKQLDDEGMPLGHTCDHPKCYDNVLPPIVLQEGDQQRIFLFKLRGKYIGDEPDHCPPDTWRVQATCVLTDGRVVKSNLALRLGTYATRDSDITMQVIDFLNFHRRKRDHLDLALG